MGAINPDVVEKSVQRLNELRGVLKRVSIRLKETTDENAKPHTKERTDILQSVTFLSLLIDALPSDKSTKEGLSDCKKMIEEIHSRDVTGPFKNFWDDKKGIKGVKVIFDELFEKKMLLDKADVVKEPFNNIEDVVGDKSTTGPLYEMAKFALETYSKLCKQGKMDTVDDETRKEIGTWIDGRKGVTEECKTQMKKIIASESMKDSSFSSFVVMAPRSASDDDRSNDLKLRLVHLDKSHEVFDAVNRFMTKFSDAERQRSSSRPKR